MLAGLRYAWLACFAALLCSCAHSYYYSPEIPGDGAVHGKKGGVIYDVPPGSPELIMRLRSLGVHKIKDKYFLGMRMSFARPAGFRPRAQVREFLNPDELFVKIGDGPNVKPGYVHTKAKVGNVMEFTGRGHEVVELLFPLPNNTDGASQLVRYSFGWTLHYGIGKTETRLAHFNRYDAAPQQAGSLFPEDPDYPYDVSPIDMPGWTVIRDPLFWWPREPWRPWW